LLALKQALFNTASKLRLLLFQPQRPLHTYIPTVLANVPLLNIMCVTPPLHTGQKLEKLRVQHTPSPRTQTPQGWFTATSNTVNCWAPACPCIL